MLHPADQLARVRQRIANAEHKAGVVAGHVELVAVTKKHDIDVVRQLYDLGLRQFGESRVQELIPKVRGLPDDIVWHMLGHLQENKINKVIPHVGLLQSIDSIALARAVDKRASNLGLSVPVLLEVKTSHETNKTGVSLQEAPEVYAACAALPMLQLRGLMTMAPHTDEESVVRQSFSSLRRLSESLSAGDAAGDAAGDSPPQILSMGMSQDFEWAILEGSNMVRIGRALVDP